MVLAIEVNGARRSYAHDLAPVRALRGVHLAVEQGEFVAVTGPSGSGKSTLVRAIAGLEPLDEGRVSVAGHELCGRDEPWLAQFRRREVGLVSQSFELLADVSAADNVALAAQLVGRSRREARRRAQDLLVELGLGARSDQPPSTLSGGERQRLSIARALVNEPPLLLADEPTGALDSAGSAGVVALLERLHGSGVTILLVTHSPAAAARADRVLELRDGSLRDGGDPGGQARR